MHTIRLRGPWELQPTARARRINGHLLWERARLPAAGRVRMPGDWRELLGAEFYGRVEFRRRFGRPLEGPPARCVLVVGSAFPQGRVFVNGEFLGLCEGEPTQFPLAALQPRNQLMIEVEVLPPPPAGEPPGPGSLGDVWLEFGES